MTLNSGNGSPAASPSNRSPSGSGRSSPKLGSGAPSKASKLDSGAPSKVSKLSSSSWRAASHIGSVVDDWPMYSSQPSDYILGPAVGVGASSVVYQASFLPLNGRACAVKVIDLEAFGRDLAELRRETQLMSLSKHPNVLRVRGCWVSGTKLHIATRLMNAGSMLDIMRFEHPDGFNETVIATVLKQALEGLNYLHINGWLHRDLKAANVLVDDDGTVLLGDFGVGVYLTEASKLPVQIVKGASSDKDESKMADRIDQASRKSFVGTPCWMAPEVVERKGYGAKADIWSFGITALELSSGRAPHSRLPPVKVLMRTLQDEPPMLDREGGAHKYSKLFDDFIKQCLQKDPVKRPSAEKLLQHGFFRQAKSSKYLAQSILAALPPLSERQERQRAMSIASLQNQASWDFSTSAVNSRITTPAFENHDPFSNFSGAVATPQGSIRSNRNLVDAGADNRRDSWKASVNGGSRRSRPASGEYGTSAAPPPNSWSRRSRAQRLSVSFHVDAVGKVDEEQEVSMTDVDGVASDLKGSTIDSTDQQSSNVRVNQQTHPPATEAADASTPGLTDTSVESSKASSESSAAAKTAADEKHSRAAKRFSNLFNRQ